jgi:hypothetical protein
MRPPGWPHSVSLLSAQDMKGFPITLASYKKSLQMAAPSESLEKRSFIWSVRGTDRVHHVTILVRPSY